jgi:hypothetical protein
MGETRLGSARWASWELGELSDAVWLTADLLASATPVESLTVRTPVREGEPPRVLVIVCDQASVLRLAKVVQAMVADRGGRVEFTGRFEQRRWTADLGDLVLTVATREGVEYAALTSAGVGLGVDVDHR